MKDFTWDSSIVCDYSNNSVKYVDYKIKVDRKWILSFREEEKRMEEDRKKKELQEKQEKNKRLRGMVKRVIFNGDRTIVFWNDGTKTIARCHKDDMYDQEKGILVCMAKKLYEGTNIFQEVIDDNVSNLNNGKNYYEELKRSNKMLLNENLELINENLELISEINSLKDEILSLNEELGYLL